MRSKLTFSNIFIGLIVIISILLLGFKGTENKNPKIAYNVYVDGEKIGVVESKEELEKYIDINEIKIKEKFNVDKVYTPKGVEIRKINTYSTKTDDVKSIYNKLIKSKSFTVKGWIITVTDEENNKTNIYVLNKDIFDKAIIKTIKAFVGEDKYNDFINDKQEEIKDLGSLIENIGLKDVVTYREDYISVSENIFTNVDDLGKYLLYGSSKNQETYYVKAGDTIETIASNNKLNVQEFLIANPQFNSVNNLLYESQVVNIGLVDPIINIIVDIHSVEEEERPYEVEIKYDDELVKGYEYVAREGENGLYKVTKKYQYINGQLSDTVNVSASEIKPPVNKILVKGQKYIPNVADLSYWAWPTQKPYTITTYFEYRWGSFHDALDIAGPGYGSDIYAANNGTVVKTVYNHPTSGTYIVINHNVDNYYTIYMHLSSILVKEGLTVSRGQKIATMGNTGHVVPAPTPSNPYAGTHLHFGLWKGMPYGGGYAVNPMNIF